MASLDPDDALSDKLEASLFALKMWTCEPHRHTLDTNIASDLSRNRQGSVFKRFAALGSYIVWISIITAAELRYACAKKTWPKAARTG